MQYNLKEKLVVTEEYLNDLISKSWLETEAIQQQIANIDASTKLGAGVVKILKNACTNYYVLIGCLEALAENPNSIEITGVGQETFQNTTEQKVFDEPAEATEAPKEILSLPVESNDNFEPFEYFVDFEEPSGDPLSDEDLYG